MRAMSDAPFRSQARGTQPSSEPTAAAKLWQLWRQGHQPNLDSFLATAGALDPSETAAVLRVDQRARWQLGECVPAEEYLRRWPAVSESIEDAVDLVFNEFLLREQRGDSVAITEYPDRFPQYADTLRAQIELHRAMAAGPSLALAETPASASVAPDSQAVSTPHCPGEAFAPFPSLPCEFGRYRIERLLGQGGMSAVYLAHDVDLDRHVALKVPRFGEGTAGPLVQRLLREAKIAATFRHPSLCPVYDVGQIDGLYYLTMPVLHGEPLSVRVRRDGPMPQRTAAEFIARVARALAVAHEAGVIHRDLKPANIMVTDHGEPVVMDFGLARRAVIADPRLTASGAILGTPAYLPPEQIGGEFADARCDVYSLGVVLYEMLTGELPFQGSAHTIFRLTLTEPPQPPSRRRAELDSRLDATCMTAMAKAPEARFPTMDAFAEALESYLSDSVRETGKAPRPASRSYSHRVRAILIATLCIALLATVTWFAISTLFRKGQADAGTDILPSGSEWSGTYDFQPPFDEKGTVQVKIVSRDADDFAGTYKSHPIDGSIFEWRIRGTLHGDNLHWDFVEQLRGPAVGRALVGHGSVEGTCQNRLIEAIFRDSNDHSVAELRLERKQ
jgi:serine/threonine protein kinase